MPQRETARCSLQFGGEKFHMRRKLAIQFGGRAAAAQQPGQQHAQGGHGSLSSRRAIIATVRDQPAASAVSCLRPARVME